MIELRPEQICGRGSRRTCYRHPHDPTRCIKISTGTPASIRQERREARYMRWLQKRGYAFTHVPRYFGTERTTLGEGHVFELVLDHGGDVSKSVMHYLHIETECSTELMGHLDRLRRHMQANRLMVYDFSDCNMMWQRLPGDQRRLMLIDGVGDTSPFLFLNLHRGLHGRKLDRRWSRPERVLWEPLRKNICNQRRAAA